MSGNFTQPPTLPPEWQIGIRAMEDRIAANTTIWNNEVESQINTLQDSSQSIHERIKVVQNLLENCAHGPRRPPYEMPEHLKQTCHAFGNRALRNIAAAILSHLGSEQQPRVGWMPRNGVKNLSRGIENLNNAPLALLVSCLEGIYDPSTVVGLRIQQAVVVFQLCTGDATAWGGEVPAALGDKAVKVRLAGYALFAIVGMAQWFVVQFNKPMVLWDVTIPLAGIVSGGRGHQDD